MSSDKKKKAWAENGLEDWGAYMAAKKEKLEDQFEEAAKKEFCNATSLFSGIAIFVNGYTNPCADELKRLMMAHGGIYHHYMRSGRTTHIIASNLPYSKIVAYSKSQNPLPICKPEWITDSLAAGKLLDWRNYLLYSNCTKTQPQLQFSKSNRAAPMEGLVSADVPRSTANPQFLTEFYNNSRLHHISTMGATFKDYVNELRAKSDGTFPGLERLRSKSERTSTAVSSDSETEDVFGSGVSSPRANSEKKRRSVLMHIDMDCFFVSVGLRERPELRGLPVAVTHARADADPQRLQHGSMSEIASCSYEARKAGLKNGMFLGQALKLCPELKTMSYDFEAYRDVSYALYDTVASYTLLIEAVSCDEMYADVTRVLEESGLDPLQFADTIREEIQRKTGCPVSTGFGINKLQARLATRKAKPNGQFYFDPRRFRDYTGSMSVTDLPGVGHSTKLQLSERMNVRTCSDLHEIPLSVLQKEFGKKSGETLYNLCRGIDDSKLTLEHVRKSVSAEVNYGIRFENPDEALAFLRQLSNEVSTRLRRANSKGRSVTLKLMVRAKDAPKEALKFMGHGICDNFTKSKNFVGPMDDPVVIAREVISLWNQMRQPYEDIRGIGIQISRLESTRATAPTMMNFIRKTKETIPAREKSDEGSAARLETSEPTLKKFITAKEKTTFGGGGKSPEDGEDKPGSKVELPEDVRREILETRPENRNQFPSVDYDESVLKELPEDIRNEILGRKKEPPEVPKRVVRSRQTHQENYFKHAKATSGKQSSIGASKMPSIDEIDMAVLIELPEDIRNEIMNEYRTEKRLNETEATGGESTKERSNENAEKMTLDEANLSFSQVDPEFLAALPDDTKTDVRMYCMLKKRETRVNKSAFDTITKNRNSSKVPKKKRGRPKSSNKITRNVAGPVEKNTKNELVVDKNNDRSERLLERELNADTEIDDGSIEQRLEIISHHSSFTGDRGRTEEHEMIARLVNYLFTLPRQQVKMQIQTWISKSERVNEIDSLSLATFLSMLPRKKRLEDLHVLMKTMHRCITKTGSCVWHVTYGRTLDHVQRYMQIEYNSKMMLPTIKCDRCDCETNPID